MTLPGRTVLAMLAGAMLAGCAGILEPEWRRVVGNIALGLPEVPLEAPASVQRGVSFPVSVTTYGSSTCTRPDGAEHRVTGLTAEITPYDFVANGSRPCTADFHPFPRPVVLRFDQAGEARIRVAGRGDGGLVYYEGSVTVLP